MRMPPAAPARTLGARLRPRRLAEAAAAASTAPHRAASTVAGAGDVLSSLPDSPPTPGPGPSGGQADIDRQHGLDLDPRPTMDAEADAQRASHAEASSSSPAAAPDLAAAAAARADATGGASGPAEGLRDRLGAAEDAAQLPTAPADGSLAAASAAGSYAVAADPAALDAVGRGADAEQGGEASPRLPGREVGEKEAMRRRKISEGNKGKMPWNKGVKHSPGVCVLGGGRLRCDVVAYLTAS
jgi:NUMOD3 motif